MSWSLLALTGCGERERSAAELAQQLQEGVVAQDEAQREMLVIALTRWAETAQARLDQYAELARAKAALRVHDEVERKRGELRTAIGVRIERGLGPELDALKARVDQASARVAQGDAVALGEQRDAKLALAAALTAVYKELDDFRQRVDAELNQVRSDQLALIAQSDLTASLIAEDPRTWAEGMAVKAWDEDGSAAVSAGFDALSRYLTSNDAKTFLSGLMPSAGMGSMLIQGLNDTWTRTYERLQARVESAVEGIATKTAARLGSISLTSR